MKGSWQMANKTIQPIATLRLIFSMARTLRAEPSVLLIAIRFCPGASRQSIKRLQQAAVPASKLACTSAAGPQRRWQ
jgi:hypothetical protein